MSRCKKIVWNKNGSGDWSGEGGGGREYNLSRDYDGWWGHFYSPGERVCDQYRSLPDGYHEYAIRQLKRAITIKKKQEAKQ